MLPLRWLGCMYQTPTQTLLTKTSKTLARNRQCSMVYTREICTKQVIWGTERRGEHPSNADSTNIRCMGDREAGCGQPCARCGGLKGGATHCDYYSGDHHNSLAYSGR
jgi:hypothetical protein